MRKRERAHRGTMTSSGGASFALMRRALTYSSLRSHVCMLIVQEVNGREREAHVPGVRVAGTMTMKVFVPY